MKRYGVLFTCLAIRAVHIEVASSLHTDSFINALRRFIARRDVEVRELRSDNGTNFEGAERELKRALEEWNQGQIHDVKLQKGIQWSFNPPAGSHHGGAWERLIRSVRKVLNSNLKVQNLDKEGLHTVFCEIEGIINSRPITKASFDPNDLEALTPNHLLLLKTLPTLTPPYRHVCSEKVETGPIHVRSVLKKVDKGIPSPTAGVSEMDSSEKESCCGRSGHHNGQH